MRYPFEKQRDLKDCGVCSLLMIVRYFGGSVSKEYLRELTNTTKSGVTAYDLINGAKKLGFDSYGVKGSIEDILINDTPLIAHIIYKKNVKHFIVIYKIDKHKKELLVADPNNNRVTKMSFSLFNSISSGIFIILKPRKKILYINKNTYLKNLIDSFIKLYVPKIIYILVLSFLLVLINILLSFEFKILLEYVINYNTTYNLLLLSLILIGIILLKEISSYERNKVLNDINHKFDKLLFNNVYNHILSLPYLYYKNRTTGEIVSRMNDLSNIRDFFSKFLVSVLIDFIFMISSVIVLMFLNLKLSLIVLIMCFIISSIIIITNKLTETKVLKTKENLSNLNSYLTETISGIDTVKNQNIVPYCKKKFFIKYCNYNNNSYSVNSTFIILDFIKNLINSIGNLLILIIGSILVINKELDIATLIAFISLTSYVFNPINNFVELLLSFKEAKVSFDRIRELYEVEVEKETKYDKNIIFNGDIKTDNLSYSYNNKDLLLKDINLDIKKNDRVLIYGKSGSGKSTIAKILAGLLDIKNNKLYYDSKDINRYNKNVIRNNVCYIGSNELLFNDTIRNNILFDKDIDSNIYEDSINISLVNDFISNTVAYDELSIEENGFNLSGGQKQRIILARSLLRNANIYILDESLNQVDIDKERQILTNIFDKYKDKTFIYISHRFNNADLFNKKYRIDDGVSFNESI